VSFPSEPGAGKDPPKEPSEALPRGKESDTLALKLKPGPPAQAVRAVAPEAQEPAPATTGPVAVRPPPVGIATATGAARRTTADPSDLFEPARAPTEIGTRGQGARTAAKAPSAAPSTMTGPVGPRFCPTCGAERPSNAALCPSCGALVGEDPLVGKVVDGRYEVVAKLGAGGMGAVYEVRHLRLMKRFAMKVIHRELTLIPEFVARFEREALSTSRLDHPNCISVTDFGHAPTGELYLVMEYLEGKPLSEYLEGPISARRALDITRQLLLGLQHAHQVGVIHRDIKPENVMRLEGSEGSFRVKILDFGIAKLPFVESGASAPSPLDLRASKVQHLTRAGVVMGTPLYMAPEAVLTPNVDGRADLYAVGVILWRLLTAKNPLEGEDQMDLLTAKLMTPAPPLEKVAPGLFSPSLAELLRRALERKPQDRFSSAAEMLEALDAILAEPGEGMALRPKKTSRIEAIVTALHPVVEIPSRLKDAYVGWYVGPVRGGGAAATTGKSPRPAWLRRLRDLFTTASGAVVLATALLILGIPVLMAILSALGDDDAAVISTGAPSPGSRRRGARLPVATPPKTRPAAVDPVTAIGKVVDRARDFLGKGYCREAEVELKNLLRDHPKVASAHYFLGAALICRRYYSDGLAAYAQAIALEDGYRADARILEDAEKLLKQPRINLGALEFLGTKVGQPALAKIVEAASTHPRREVRWRAAQLVEKLGATSQINWVAALALDLDQTQSCKQREEILGKIVALKDRRAIAVLRQAKETRAGFWGSRLKHHCIRKQLADALAALQSLPVPPDAGK
jgi:eukaryotic-like serine/threonine-protein kinase